MLFFPLDRSGNWGTSTDNSRLRRWPSGQHICHTQACGPDPEFGSWEPLWRLGRGSSRLYHQHSRGTDRASQRHWLGSPRSEFSEGSCLKFRGGGQLKKTPEPMCPPHANMHTHMHIYNRHTCQKERMKCLEDTSTNIPNRRTSRFVMNC